MKEPTQAEIVALANKHKDSNDGINILLISYNESKMQAIHAVNTIDSYVGIIHYALGDKNDYRIQYDNTDIVAQSHKLATALSKMSICLMNLACLLQKLGEDIRY